ncbi:MAG TPA: hypothetical protein DCG57_19045 [Candidatus Riflebacteria bacterium]|jgi:hypothetical protein|nr:hypothetical protein [Candidatus Riflebacteria bacterium]
MMTMTYSQRQNVSTMLLISMLFSLWVAVSPVGQLHASFLAKAKDIGKAIFVNVGAVGAGLAGGALGMALGGGPLGMAAGAIGGFIVGKKVLNWTTSSVANFATVVGAVAGGALCIGMGFPMLAVGVIGGGLIARLAVMGVSKLFGKKTVVLKQSDIDPAAAAKERAEAADFMAKMTGTSTVPVTSGSTVKKTTSAAAAPEAKAPAKAVDSQTAYSNYLAAYKQYMEATQKGNAALAKSAYTEYKTNLDLYNLLIKGK